MGELKKNFKKDRHSREQDSTLDSVTYFLYSVNLDWVSTHNYSFLKM